MRFRFLHITPQVAEKIQGKHGVTPNEAREALEQGKVFRGPRSHHGGMTYIVKGRTYAGRQLWLLVRPTRPGVALLITARDD